MCGIAGFLADGGAPQDLAGRAQAMANTLTHRGPDDAGVWVEPEAGLALAHRRLAILDLSAEGRQPMASHCGRYCLAFNGEIYNFREIRARLDAEARVPWRGHSDTEVLLAAIATWGLKTALERAVGMFALALWDRRGRVLTLARDRMGEKPLYYGWQQGVFLFGSELKALRAHPAFTAGIDRDALALMLEYAYVPTPWSIYQGISKLPPGHWLQVGVQGAREAGPRAYWSVRAAAERGLADPLDLSPREAAGRLEEGLAASVRQQMVADVPLGAFLSGGVDSSAVVALMQAHSDQPVRTFSIGFREQAFDEARYAKAVARHLGTDHTELYLTPDQALEVIPRLPQLYDEPFGDSSQIPTLLVAELARRHVTVALSGDGGDELFAGYNRYFWAAGLWRRLQGIPQPLRRLLAQALTLPSPAAWDRLFRILTPLLPAALRQPLPGDKVHKVARILPARGPEEIYRNLISLWDDPTATVPGSREPQDPAGLPRDVPFEQRMLYLDQTGYLPDDILVKVDRAAMGVSLETRIPLLDHRLVEFAWRLPLDLKIREGQSKWLLRQVLYRHVPRELIERPKQGFGIPLAAWLRGPLRDWCEALLDPARLRREGWFDPAPIQARWQEHLGGHRNRAYGLWNVLMFQAWLETQG